MGDSSQLSLLSTFGEQLGPITVGSRYLEVQGTLWNNSRYPYLDITALQNWGRYKPNNPISQMNI